MLEENNKLKSVSLSEKISSRLKSPSLEEERDYVTKDFKKALRIILLIFVIEFSIYLTTSTGLIDKIKIPF